MISEVLVTFGGVPQPSVKPKETEQGHNGHREGGIVGGHSGDQLGRSTDGDQCRGADYEHGVPTRHPDLLPGEELLQLTTGNILEDFQSQHRLALLSQCQHHSSVAIVVAVLLQTNKLAQSPRNGVLHGLLTPCPHSQNFVFLEINRHTQTT